MTTISNEAALESIVQAGSGNTVFAYMKLDTLKNIYSTASGALLEHVFTYLNSDECKVSKIDTIRYFAINPNLTKVQLDDLFEAVIKFNERKNSHLINFVRFFSDLLLPFFKHPSTSPELINDLIVKIYLTEPLERWRDSMVDTIMLSDFRLTDKTLNALLESYGNPFFDSKDVLDSILSERSHSTALTVEIPPRACRHLSKKQIAILFDKTRLEYNCILAALTHNIHKLTEQQKALFLVAGGKEVKPKAKKATKKAVISREDVISYLKKQSSDEILSLLKSL